MDTDQPALTDRDAARHDESQSMRSNPLGGLRRMSLQEAKKQEIQVFWHANFIGPLLVTSHQRPHFVVLGHGHADRLLAEVESETPDSYSLSQLGNGYSSLKEIDGRNPIPDGVFFLHSHGRAGAVAVYASPDAFVELLRRQQSQAREVLSPCESTAFKKSAQQYIDFYRAVDERSSGARDRS